jgi:nucleotide-binding universal stress UspA family protein
VFKHILVPVDLSDRHQHALEVAACLARESHGEVTLLHVIEIIPGPWPQERRATWIATREENGALLWDIRLQGDGETVLLSFPGA